MCLLLFLITGLSELVLNMQIQLSEPWQGFKSGEVIEVKGNEEIEYDGEIHTAANLYDALKEGYYGKF